VTSVQGIERCLAVVQGEESDGGDAEHEVGAPHRQEGRHESGVPGLFSKSDEHVVDEDHRDRKREGGRARLLAVAERQPETEHAEDEAGGRDGELLVPLDLETGRGLAPFAARETRADLGGKLAESHLPVPFAEGHLGEEFVEGQGEGEGLELLLVVVLRLGEVEGVADTLPQFHSDGSARLVDHEAPGVGEDQLAFRLVPAVVDEDVGPLPGVRGDVRDE
jgi:hypothetical protein